MAKKKDGIRTMSLVFGPAPSRRLGRSLGVDLVPHKTCSFDCIYCQLGATTRKTDHRRLWVKSDDVLRELEERLDASPDYITFSGSGEPTLNAEIGRIIRRVKSMSGVPVAVLTNGSLLHRPEVREDLMSADVVIPSLDADGDLLFRHINRPHPDITYTRLVEGLHAFREEYPGRIWLTVMLLSGINALTGEAERIASVARSLRPDRIFLNTPTRPPTEEFAVRVPPKQLHNLACLFGPDAEVVGNAASPTPLSARPVTAPEITDLLRRRPCTIEEIAFGLGAEPRGVSDAVDELIRDGIIHWRRFKDQSFLTVETPSLDKE